MKIDRTGLEWYTPKINRQIWVRFQIAMAAYAYEALSHPIMSDSEFDKLALEVDLSIDTRRPDLDEWFRKEYQPHTGSWIWRHPELNIIKVLTERKLNA